MSFLSLPCGLDQTVALFSDTLKQKSETIRGFFSIRKHFELSRILKPGVSIYGCQLSKYQPILQTFLFIFHQPKVLR